LLTVARLMIDAALRREESRGTHFRSDFPTRDDNRWGTHHVVAPPAESNGKDAGEPVELLPPTPAGKTPRDEF
jgi:succinate dehydrogenase/fumarate reductase flavoprotein subunit